MANKPDLSATLRHNSDPLNWPNSTTWNAIADQYDLVVGRATLNGAKRLIELADAALPFRPDNHVKDSIAAPAPLPRRVIDLGAGTGAVAFSLCERFPALDILAVDISAGMLDRLSAKQQAQEQHGTASRTPIRTQVADMSAPLSQTPTPSPGTAPALSTSLASTFTHALSLAAVQATSDNLACLHNMHGLLVPGGCCAVGNWDFENECAVHDVWALAAVAADPTYVVPPVMPPGRWTGMAELEAGMEAAGFVDLRSEIVKCQMPIEGGTEGFVTWFFGSANPAAAERLRTFGGDVEVLKGEMRRVLEERYEGATKLVMDVDVVVGIKAS